MVEEKVPVYFFYDKATEYAKEEHIFLNNFEPSPFVENDIKYLTVEHYYQAHKFKDFSKEGFKEKFNEIVNAENADICKKASRAYTRTHKPEDWDQESWDKVRKDIVMKKALVYKYSQNRDLLKKLMDTGNAILKEESKKDKYWGGLIEGSLNRLGEMLMELRDNYKKTKTLFIEGSGLEVVKD